jgi:hypothetical protein
MARYRTSATVMWETLLIKQGYGTFSDIIEDVEERFGRDEAVRVGEDFDRAIEADRRRSVAVGGVNYLAEPSLLALPEPLFLDAVEHGFREGIRGYAGSRDVAAREINEILERRGVFFRFSSHGMAHWVGDQGVYVEVVAPALEALRDPRLAGAQNEFEAALRHLRQGGAKDEEDAIEEAGKAVESTMKVLLDERHVARSGKEAAFTLFELLRTNSLIEAEADHAISACARIRNQWGGHGAGGIPRTPPPGLAALAVHAAASAIGFLSQRLP